MSTKRTTQIENVKARILGTSPLRGFSIVPFVLNWAFALLLLSISSYLTIKGARLVSLGGNWYYFLSGLALLAAAVLLVLRDRRAPRIYAAITAITVLWALAETGLQFMNLLPRLGAWLVVGLWFLSPWYAAVMKRGSTDLSAPGRKWIAGATAFGVVVLAIATTQGYSVADSTRVETASAPAKPDWRHYGSSAGGTRFSGLDQITRSNISDLKEVWRFRTGIPYEFKNTPLQVEDLLYVCTAGNIVIAVDATTGEEQWRYNPVNTTSGSTVEELKRGNYFSRTCRGLGYHEAANSAGGQCTKRIVNGTTDARLITLDAKTGAVCEDFGDGGEVNLRTGMGPHKPFDYMVTSPPLIAGDRIVVGGWVIDNQEYGNPSGVVRAYDVQTGAFEWAWDMGNPDSNQLPPEGEYFTRGTPNVWSMMSYDEDLDLVFAPTGNASPDYYGAKRRPFDEKYASSIVALNGQDGSVAWSYQTVHHDIWDYDAPSQPTVVDLTVDGENVPALLAPTKRGEIFVLDRRTGLPVYPATTCPDGSAATEAGECPVPQGPIDSDFLSPTQPFSGVHHFRPTKHEKDMWGLTPLDQLFCRVEFRKMRYEGHFTPPMPGGGGPAFGGATWGGTFQFPGNAGGFNWPSVSVDADNGWVVAQMLMNGNRVVMRAPEDLPGPQKKLQQLHAPSVNTDQQAVDPSVPRFAITEPFLSTWKIPLLGVPLRTPCLELPISNLAVIDLNTNSLVWSRPIGRINIKGKSGSGLNLPYEIGMPAIGGTMTTRGGLIFELGTLDSMMRAVDIQTGDILWTDELPTTSKSTPITYEVDGKQYVAVVTPAPASDAEGGWVIAYALEESD
ncbi:MAG: PQQ-binding-like beta-propeller repeat protein [Pseudomonadota bacterium]